MDVSGSYASGIETNAEQESRRSLNLLRQPSSPTAVVNRRRQKHYGGQESTSPYARSAPEDRMAAGEIGPKTLPFLYFFFTKNDRRKIADFGTIKLALVA
jgi:hypothetical protein